MSENNGSVEFVNAAPPEGVDPEFILDTLEKKVDWLVGAMDATGRNVQGMAMQINMVMQALMQSPMGGIIKAQMAKQGGFPGGR
jgi:hypothetical protein